MRNAQNSLRTADRPRKRQPLIVEPDLISSAHFGPYSHIYKLSTIVLQTKEIAGKRRSVSTRVIALKVANYPAKHIAKRFRYREGPIGLNNSLQQQGLTGSARCLLAAGHPAFPALSESPHRRLITACAYRFVRGCTATAVRVQSRVACGASGTTLSRDSGLRSASGNGRENGNRRAIARSPQTGFRLNCAPKALDSCQPTQSGGCERQNEE